LKALSNKLLQRAKYNCYLAQDIKAFFRPFIYDQSTVLYRLFTILDEVFHSQLGCKDFKAISNYLEIGSATSREI
jgi:hypothetical protein